MLEDELRSLRSHHLARAAGGTAAWLLRSSAALRAQMGEALNVLWGEMIFSQVSTGETELGNNPDEEECRS